MSPRRLVKFFWKFFVLLSRNEIVLTEIARRRPDSSVAHVTSTCFAPIPPDMRRSAPDAPAVPGGAGSASFRLRRRSSAAQDSATAFETFSVQFFFVGAGAESGGFAGKDLIP